MSSLVWCRPTSKKERFGRLLSSSLDGSVLEWDIISLKQKVGIYLLIKEFIFVFLKSEKLLYLFGNFLANFRLFVTVMVEFRWPSAI